MLHERQGLPLSLKSGDDLPRIHAGLDHFERNPAANGLSLFSHEDDAHSPLTDLLQQLVRAYDRAGALFDSRRLRRTGRRLQEGTKLRLRFQKGPKVLFLARLGARFVQKGFALVDIGNRQGGDEDIAFLHGVRHPKVGRFIWFQ